jgi:septum formation protein
MSEGRRQLVLASTSPRRRELLRLAGFEAAVDEPDVDDGRLDPSDRDPEAWVLAMAFFKARRVADRRRHQGDVVLGADTVCVHDGRILGKPRGAHEAIAMLEALRDGVHQTLSGVCLIETDTFRRTLVLDRAEVRVGRLDDAEIGSYVRSGDWQGKAGGYNLSERIDAGWPIECQGDPTSVMGLPMNRLAPILNAMLRSPARPVGSAA